MNETKPDNPELRHGTTRTTGAATPATKEARKDTPTDGSGKPKGAMPPGEVPKQTFKQRVSRAWRITQIAAWVVLGGVLGYVGGAIEGKLDLRQQATLFTQSQAELQERYAQAARRERVLLARRDLHRALISLQQRNFGTTEKHARQAGTLLAEVGGDYAQFSEELKSFRPTVSDDIGQQREDLLATAARLDELLGELPETEPLPPPEPAGSAQAAGE